MAIKGGNNGRHDNGEGHFISRSLVNGFWKKKLNSISGGKGPVIVLSRSVDIVERLLLKKSCKSMTGSNLLNNLHYHQVLINLSCVGSEKGCEFELSGGYLTMTSLEWNSKLPAFFLNLSHTGKGGCSTGERSHVVITHFLSTGGILANDGTSGKLKIGTSVVFLTGYKEEFLLQSNVGDNSSMLLSIKSKVLQETICLLIQGSVGTKKGCLLIQGSSIVGNKRGRYKDGVSTKEDGRGCIYGKVSSGTVSPTKSTIGEGGSISFTSN
mmetsp:Transcript_13600/g.20247  ORF Transcript_13600/g.20247 Transcript_13600/m.20247 type:complete len:268 (-) Transcript_13600:428-1231(-)